MRCLQTNSKKWALTRILGLFLTVAATPLMMPAVFIQAIASDSDSDSDSESVKTSMEFNREFDRDKYCTNIKLLLETAAAKTNKKYERIQHGTAENNSKNHTGTATLYMRNNFISKEELEKFNAQLENLTSEKPDFEKIEQFFADHMLKEYNNAIVNLELSRAENDKAAEKIFTSTAAHHYAGLWSFYDVAAHILAFRMVFDTVQDKMQAEIKEKETASQTELETFTQEQALEVALLERELKKYKKKGKEISGSSVRAQAQDQYKKALRMREANIDVLKDKIKTQTDEKKTQLQADKTEIENKWGLIPNTFKSAFKPYGSWGLTQNLTYARSTRESRLNYGVIESHITDEMITSVQDKILLHILKAPSQMMGDNTDRRIVDLLTTNKKKSKKLYGLFHLLDVDPEHLEDLAKIAALQIHDELLKEQQEKTSTLERTRKTKASAPTSATSAALSRLRKTTASTQPEEEPEIEATSTTTSTTPDEATSTTTSTSTAQIRTSGSSTTLGRPMQKYVKKKR